MSFQVSERPLRTYSSSACTNLRRRQGNFLKNFKGVSLNDLSYFKQRHNLRIHVYSLHFHPQDHSRLPFARLERRPLHVGDSSTTDLYLNLFDYTHFSYIHNLSLYAQTFGCTRCPKLLKSSKDLLYQEPVCFVENKDPRALIDQMMSYLDQMADVVFDKQMEIFEPVFADIDQTLSDITQNDFAHESHPLHKLKEKLAQCLRVLTCVALIVANMISISSGYTCSSD